MPKFFYFDLGNVLLTFDHRTACVQLGTLVGVPPAKVWEVMFASELQTRYEQGLISSRRVYETFCRGCCDSLRNWPTYGQFYLAHSDIFRLHVPLMPIATQLCATGYPLGILSNTCEEHWKHIYHARFPVLARLFPVAVLSYEQGESKPQAGIYETAARRAGVEPKDVFFVDDREDNVAGARQAGLDAVRLHKPQQLAAALRSRGVRFNY
ncbi:MAG: HAD family hydrolase [Planctomycetota bacterium]